MSNIEKEEKVFSRLIQDSARIIKSCKVTIREEKQEQKRLSKSFARQCLVIQNYIKAFYILEKAYNFKDIKTFFIEHVAPNNQGLFNEQLQKFIAEYLEDHDGCEHDNSFKYCQKLETLLFKEE
ncbi:hypothetical protein D4R87_02340 [bacterium]|nr:MAG: hypothetical protein D4R87_02340 [bacterium]